jgi:subtilase family serine protease
MASIAKMTEAATMRTSGGVIGIGQSPSFIRTRYGFDGLTTPAQQGSGQVIAIISAYNNPNAAADLAKFSAQHGLAPCTVVKTVFTKDLVAKTFLPNTPKPLAGDGCTFQVINVTSTGEPYVIGNDGGTSAWVSADGNWMAESTMDIEWAHAMAPMASIVLVQAPNNFVSALSYATQYASTFADVVSMSWGAPESAFAAGCPTIRGGGISPTCTSFKQTTTLLYGPAAAGTAGGYDTIGFTNSNVTYVAASGDRSVPLWPAVSTKVLSVGGTNNKGLVDVGWSGSGGGLSAYYTAPAWQSISGSPTRAVPDVAYNGDSASAMSVYITPSTWVPDASCVKTKGANSCGWYGGYGTSLGAPQWAGIAAITRAVRAENSKSIINFTAGLYTVASVPGYYATAFGDVLTGSNGNAAKTGYDLVTGLGVPNASVLVNYLAQQ